ncbi:MAG: DUF3883 domain-containing protein [Candidatus Manganitrophus sp. SB1]|nr:DUF3883 domain-containing protein [Candidatus Manganitrophus morganii]
MDKVVGTTPGSERQEINELASQQIDLYRRQGFELISHYNRENSALDGYRGRQILEILQNADDSGVEAEGTCTLLLDSSRERLIVANTGKPFNKKGLTSLVISDCSPKQLGRNRFIGSKGLGFRSVLTWTDCPLISSGQYEVMFDRAYAIEEVQRLAAESAELKDIVGPFRENMGRVPAPIMRFPAVPSKDHVWLKTARNYRAQGYDTVVVLPLPEGIRGDTVHKEIIEQLSGLPTSSLLFCRHLTSIKITGDIEQKWELFRENNKDDEATIILRRNGTAERWNVYWHTGQVSAEIADTSSGGRRDFEVAVAVPEQPKIDPAGTLCVFFPTHEQLPCSMVLHATLETSDDRNRVVKQASNQEVLRQLAIQVGKVAEIQASSSDPRRVLNLLRGIENSDPELKILGFLDELIKECTKRAIFPRLDGELSPPTDVRKPPHVIWLELLSPNLFPEVLSIEPQSDLRDLLGLFTFSWFDAATLKNRLQNQLLSVERSQAGEMIGRLLAVGQLYEIGVNDLLIGSNGRLIGGKACFFTPNEALPTLPPWVSEIHFLDREFQEGLLSGSNVTTPRFLEGRLYGVNGKVDEYRFDTVARALIEQVERNLSDDPSYVADVAQRWRDLLRWLYEASQEERQVLSGLSIKVITKRGSLRRATDCYLGDDYPRGQILWKLYEKFNKDEFVGAPSTNGLEEDLPVEDAQRFMLTLGVNDHPRFELFSSGSDYDRFCNATIDRLDYPRKVRGHLCKTPRDLRRLCRSYNISGIEIPDRWVQLLKEGDPVAIGAYLLSTGARLIAEEIDTRGMFYCKVEGDRRFWSEHSIPIPNATLFLLRETPWVPVGGNQRQKPSEVMLSHHGVRVLRGVYLTHGLDLKDRLIVLHGGRVALESLLTRLGAVSSLETLSDQSLYELLFMLPNRDPNGAVASGVYRTLMEFGVTPEDSDHRNRFLRSGRMWGKFKGSSSYLPIDQLRYNANLTITEAIEANIPLVDIPRRKSAAVVKQLFGISPLTSEEIQLELISEETNYDPGSEDANRHLQIAIPYIYALRLDRTIDERGREQSLLREATLRVCSQIKITARLPGGVVESHVLSQEGERIVIDKLLLVVGEYSEDRSGRLTFWLIVAELVAELLGIDIAREVGNILTCRTSAEMLEVLRVWLGSDAGQKLAEAKSRFGESFKENEDDAQPIPSPKSTETIVPARKNSSTLPGNSGDLESGTAQDPNSITKQDSTFYPISGPLPRQTKRKLVITGAVNYGSGGRGPLASEEDTFKIVEAFETSYDRFAIRVSHLHGDEGFGCDLISVGSAEIRDEALKNKSIYDADVLRYIEVKGRSSRIGDIELTENEVREARNPKKADRYFIYRVYVDPKRKGRFELAVLNNPLNSKAVRFFPRFDLGQGSGADWFKCEDVSELEE